MDLSAASEFMTTHARVLDRRRFAHLFLGGDPEGVLAALDGYRNPDGGFGWGLEGDLRAPESQPAAALHAFEVFAEVDGGPRVGALCDWLDRVTLPDGGLPMALPLGTTAGSGPWWAAADPAASSLQITSVCAARAWRVPAAHGHPWLERATAYTRSAIDDLAAAPAAHVLAFTIQFADAAGDADRLARLARWVPGDGHLPVAGGAEGEAIRPLEIAAAVTPEVLAADLERLAGEQLDDGGWDVDFASRSPAGRLDWRGFATVLAAQRLTTPAGSDPLRARATRGQTP